MLKPSASRVSACVAALACFVLASAASADDWKFDSDMFEGLHARALGPGVTSGRVSCIDAVPGDRLTLWVGSAGGGVWVSKDGATTWKPVFDKPGQPQSIGAIKVSPADPKTVWVGTGETWVRNSVGVGAGIYRTTDGGDSWEMKGLEKTERIANIVIDPSHPDTVLVAATGALWNDSPDRGVYRTRDGGKTWEKVLYVDTKTGAADIAMDPKDANTLYASMWTFRRHAWDFSSGGPGSGLFKSTDGGTTWKKLSGGLPEGALGRIGIAISPAQPNRVFASVEAKTTAFWRSDDGGAHWTRLNDSNMSVTWRPFYFSRVVADPKNADRVYKCGLTLAVSDDAGKTFGGGGGFGGASYHSDVHALWIDPRNPEWMILGCDGGVYVSQDRAATWRPIVNLPVAQFYHVSTDNRMPYHVYGGLQDNGSWMAPSRRSGGIPNRAWINVNGGDGMWAFPDPKDDDLVYSEYQGGEISRTRISTGEAKSIQPPRREGDPRLRYNWNTPIHVSPSHDGTIYLGAQFLYRSRDRGDTWERISPDLTTNDPLKQKQEESGGLSIDNSSAENNCTIYTIGESPKDANVVWVGTDDGNLQVTRDGGKSWTNVTKHLAGLPPATWISYVSPSPYDAGTCWVTADGHMQGDMSPHVFVTKDYGATFTALGANDLKGFAHVVLQDTQNPSLVFAGTEFGLWCSLDGGGRWAQVHAGIPDVPVRDMVIQQREGDLVIATHGRGIYIVDDLSSIRALTADVLNKDAAILPSRPSVLVIPSSEQRFDGDTEYSGESISESAAITYYLKKRHLIGDLRVEVMDAKGNVLQRIDGTKRRGLNRVRWAMRLKGPKMPAAANLVPNNYAFLGPRAAAGEYPVRLIRNKDTLTSVIRIVPDPRSTHTAEDRAVQVALVNKLYGMLGDLTYTVGTLKGAAEQARARADKLGKADALGKRLGAYADRLDALRGSLVALREGRLTGEVRLREELGDLYGKVNQYDGRPTESQQAAAQRLARDLDKARTGAQAALGGELGSINGALAGRKVEAIGVPTRAEFDAQ